MFVHFYIISVFVQVRAILHHGWTAMSCRMMLVLLAVTNDEIIRSRLVGLQRHHRVEITECMESTGTTRPIPRFAQSIFLTPNLIYESILAYVRVVKLCK